MLIEQNPKHILLFTFNSNSDHNFWGRINLNSNFFERYFHYYFSKKLAITSPTSGGRSVGIVSSRTKATELVMLTVYITIVVKLSVLLHEHMFILGQKVYIATCFDSHSVIT
jgi:hypothetical protein